MTPRARSRLASDQPPALDRDVRQADHIRLHELEQGKGHIWRVGRIQVRFWLGRRTPIDRARGRNTLRLERGSATPVVINGDKLGGERSSTGRLS